MAMKTIATKRFIPAKALCLMLVGLGSLGGCAGGWHRGGMSHGEPGAHGDTAVMDEMHDMQGMHNMDLGPGDATYDLRFIDAMILHHQGAVIMAEAALEQSSRPEIQQLAQEIITAQEREILQMITWRRAWYPDAPEEAVMYHSEMNHDMPMTPEMAAAMRMDLDLGQADEEFDLRFINAMVPHHVGALEMAEDVQAKSDRPELQTLADDIIASQQQEIDQMLAWRQDWYGQ